MSLYNSKIGFRDLLIVFFLSLFFLLLLTSCKDDPTSSLPDQVEGGSWVTYSPYKWTHDGQPYYTNHCIVYSDDASLEMKKRAGLFSDHKFEQILDLFNFEKVEEFRYPPGYDKIDVYLNRHHTESIAAAYWGSIFITVRSSVLDTNDHVYDYLFRHELTHAFEFLIVGMVNLSTDT